MFLFCFFSYLGHIFNSVEEQKYTRKYLHEPKLFHPNTMINMKKICMQSGESVPFSFCSTRWHKPYKRNVKLASVLQELLL